MGRPKLLDEDLIDSWCEAISTGLTPRLTCYRLGIAYSAAMNWLAKGERDTEAGEDTIEARFVDRHAHARTLRAGKWLEVIQEIAQNGEKDSDRRGSAQWLLERCEPEEFGGKSKVELTGADGGAVQVQASVVVLPGKLSVTDWVAQVNAAVSSDGDK